MGCSPSRSASASSTGTPLIAHGVHNVVVPLPEQAQAAAQEQGQATVAGAAQAAVSEPAHAETPERAQAKVPSSQERGADVVTPLPGAAAANGMEEPGEHAVTPSPSTTQRASLDGRWNALERPSQSALKGPSSRRTSIGSLTGSKVGFSVDPNSPALDEESHKHSFTNSDSVSLKKVVDLFYEKVLADPILAPFFESIDMGKLKRHQVKFMALAFGGKELVFEIDPSMDLRLIHKRLIRDKGLNMAHWVKFVSLFEETLNELPIPPETRIMAMHSVQGTRACFEPLSPEEAAVQQLGKV